MAQRRHYLRHGLPSVLCLLWLSTACVESAVCRTDADCESFGADSKCVLGERDEGLCTSYPVVDDAGPTADAGHDDAGTDAGDSDAGNPDAPAIVSFEASATTALAGSDVLLTWTTLRATSCSLDDGTTMTPGLGANETDYRVTVTPPVTYTLRCEGDGPPAQDTLAIGVELVITSFEALPPEANRGQSVTFEWAVEGATACTISGPSVTDFAVPAADLESGSVALPIMEGGVYTLTCSNSGDPKTDNVTLAIADFTTLPTAIPEAVAAGQQVTLAWELENTDTLDCDVLDGETVLTDADAAGGFQYTVTTTTTFTVRCNGNDETEPLEADVHVPVLIESVDPVDPIDFNGRPTVTFVAGGADTLCRVDDQEATSPFLALPMQASDVLELSCEDPEARIATIEVPVSVRPAITAFSGTLAKPAGTVEVVFTWDVSANSSGCSVMADGLLVPGAENLTGTSHTVTSGTGKVEYSLTCESDPTVSMDSAASVTVLWGSIDDIDLAAGNGVDLVTEDVGVTTFAGDLADLSSLREVGGQLQIQNATTLQTLSSLALLRKVLGNLTVTQCGVLASASLPALTFVGGSFTLGQNPQMGSVSMGALVDIGGTFTVTDNGLQGFVGFNALRHVRGSFYMVSGNSALPCGQVDNNYCNLLTQPATYTNSGNTGDSDTCDQEPTCQ